MGWARNALLWLTLAVGGGRYIAGDLPLPQRTSPTATMTANVRSKPCTSLVLLIIPLECSHARSVHELLADADPLDRGDHLH